MSVPLASPSQVGIAPNIGMISYFTLALLLSNVPPPSHLEAITLHSAPLYTRVAYMYIFPSPGLAREDSP